MRENYGGAYTPSKYRYRVIVYREVPEDERDPRYASYFFEQYVYVTKAEARQFYDGLPVLPDTLGKEIIDRKNGLRLASVVYRFPNED